MHTQPLSEEQAALHVYAFFPDHDYASNVPITNKTFREAGYHSVRINRATLDWTSVHTWCRLQFGCKYAWAGDLFWFTSVEDASHFALRWVQ